jgi:tetratricopeptide (TPR) repeat protein
VSYTNLGIILRHQGDIKGALKSYKKALELWDKNLSAENNINILIGKPIRERSTLERLFPDQK